MSIPNIMVVSPIEFYQMGLSLRDPADHPWWQWPYWFAACLIWMWRKRRLRRFKPINFESTPYRGPKIEWMQECVGKFKDARNSDIHPTQMMIARRVMQGARLD